MNENLQAIANIVNFLLFAFVLLKYAGPAVKKIVADRHEATMAAINSANEAKAEADTSLAERKTRLANIEAEFQTLLEQARTMATAQAAGIDEAAREEVERLKNAAKADIERERNAATQEIRQTVLQHAFDKAALELQQQMSPERQRQLVSGLMQKVGDGSLPLK